MTDHDAGLPGIGRGVLGDGRKEEVTDAKRKLLKELLNCKPGKGVPLNTPERRVAASLVRDGLVMWIEAAGMRIYIATEEARKQKALFA